MHGEFLQKKNTDLDDDLMFYVSEICWILVLGSQSAYSLFYYETVYGKFLRRNIEIGDDLIFYVFMS